jgi:hypothetical protein
VGTTKGLVVIAERVGSVLPPPTRRRRNIKHPSNRSISHPSISNSNMVCRSIHLKQVEADLQLRPWCSASLE